VAVAPLEIVCLDDRIAFHASLCRLDLFRVEKLGLEKPPNLFRREAVSLQDFDDRMHPPPGGAHPLRSGFLSPASRYVSSGTVPNFEQALVLQFGIGFGDGGVTDDDFLREGANARQLISGLQDACLYGVPNLLHDL
jgi:hypothetical protein